MQEFGYFGGCGVATDKDSCCLGSGNVDIKTNIVVLLLHAAQERNYYVYIVGCKY